MENITTLNYMNNTNLLLEDKRFYVYALLDPRKPGTYKYGSIVFEYEPFYIGKGYDKRILDHIWDAKKENHKNTPKINKIRKILLETNKNPIMLKLHTDMTNVSAKGMEIETISIIGRKNLGKGPLLNMTDGGEGSCGYICSKESAKKISIANKGRKLSQKQLDRITILFKKRGAYQKGKTWEELLGVEKAKEAREKKRKKCLGKKFPVDCKRVYIHQENTNEEKKLRIGENIPEGWIKGRLSLTEERKENLRNKMKGHLSPVSGKTWVELLGKERAENIRKKQSELAKKIYAGEGNPNYKNGKYEYSAVSPDGSVFNDIGIKSFCIDRGVNYDVLIGLIDKGKECNGWLVSRKLRDKHVKYSHI